MQAAWRLAISSLSGRRRRTALLAGAVALSAALIVGVACAMSSIHGAIRHQLAATVGAADLRLKPAGTGSVLNESELARVRAWPEVSRAAPRLQSPLLISLTCPVLEPGDTGGFVRREREFTSTALGLSLPESAAPAGDASILVPAPELIAGRLAQADDEVVLDDLLAHRLTWAYGEAAEQRDGFILPGRGGRDWSSGVERARVPERVADEAAARRINEAQGVALGAEIEVRRQALPGIDAGLGFLGLRRDSRLKVVGIAAMPPLGGRPQAHLTIEGLRRVSGARGLTQIDLAVAEGVDPEAVATARREELPRGLLLETTEKITAGLDKNMQASQLGMILATVMAFLSAAFIIMAGLSTNVTERQRELAIIRCIGGGRAQLAWAQVVIGLLIGAAGALAGVPLGVALARIMAQVFRDQLPTGMVVSWWGVLLAVLGAIGAGVLGAAWPAWLASRTSPMLGLAARAGTPRAGVVAVVTGAGIALLGVQAAIVGLPRDGQVVFWGYATAGLPLMFIGYFLLGVPAVLLVSRLASGAVSLLLRLPRRMLGRTVAATPYRHGFMAGALMAGLALMVAIWTNGGAMLRDWLDKVQFPDAFVSGLALPEAARQKLASMDVVKDTCAITLYPVETDIFGVRAIQRYKTTFVGFEPGPFFRMASLTWVQGDEETARRRLHEGGAVIVAREFLIAQGLGVGHRFTCTQGGRAHEFEIVGVVASPGLEIVSKFFNVGEDFTDQAVHAVFGSRRDMEEKFFGGEAAPAHLIQVQFADHVHPATHGVVLERIRRELAGYGVLDVGSGVQIKEQIRTFAKGMLLVFSTVAMASMLVACFGVANLIVAGVEARQFEFGVLRAIGAGRGVLGRLVAGEAVVIALSAGLLGTLMGLQGAWAGQVLHELLMGMDLRLRPPAGPIAAGWGIVIVLALLAALPAILRLNWRTPRDLLAAVRG